MYQHIIEIVTALPWAILPEKLAVIQNLLALKATGGQVSEEGIKAAMAATRGDRIAFTGGNSLAVIPIIGSLVPRGNLMLESSGAVSVQRIQAAFRAALNDKEISSIVLDIDSPGGQVGGVAELATEIYAARGQKRIIAVANGLAASAAYWLATAAEELVVTPSGEVGSIGVFAIHQDMSAVLDEAGVNITLISAGKFKTEGNPFEPLGKEARAAAQRRVDEFYDMFVGAVAKQRMVTSSAVQNGFGQGRVVGADQAVRLGMADRVQTIGQVITGLANNAKPRARGSRLDTRLRQKRAYLLQEEAG